jgi:chemotaxis methyl-accepting protein methylase
MSFIRNKYHAQYAYRFSIPSNVSLEIDDLEDPWLYNKKFDFIHCRMMTGTFRNWSRFFEQSYE